VRHWDAGRCRVPWSAVRLLRFVRLGDLGALHSAWAGWTINRNGLWSPDGKRHDPAMMTPWWLVCEQARFWRDDYGRRAAERVERASRGAATGVITGDRQSCPALGNVASLSPPSRQTVFSDACDRPAVTGTGQVTIAQSRMLVGGIEGVGGCARSAPRPALGLVSNATSGTQEGEMAQRRGLAGIDAVPERYHSGTETVPHSEVATDAGRSQFAFENPHGVARGSDDDCRSHGVEPEHLHPARGAELGVVSAHSGEGRETASLPVRVGTAGRTVTHHEKGAAPGHVSKA
jgi:Phage protein